MKYLLLGCIVVFCLVSCSTTDEINELTAVAPITNIIIVKEDGQLSIHWDSLDGTTEYLVGMGLHYDSIWNSVKKDQALLGDLPEFGGEDQFVGTAKVSGDTSMVISDFLPGQVYEIYIHGINSSVGNVDGFGSVMVETEGTALRYQGQWEKEINAESFIGWKFKKDGTCLNYSTNKKQVTAFVWEGYSQHYVLSDNGSKIHLFGEKAPARQQLDFAMEEDLSLLSVANIVYTKL